MRTNRHSADVYLEKVLSIFRKKRKSSIAKRSLLLANYGETKITTSRKLSNSNQTVQYKHTKAAKSPHTAVQPHGPKVQPPLEVSQHPLLLLVSPFADRKARENRPKLRFSCRDKSKNFAKLSQLYSLRAGEQTGSKIQPPSETKRQQGCFARIGRRVRKIST